MSKQTLKQVRAAATGAVVTAVLGMSLWASAAIDKNASWGALPYSGRLEQDGGAVNGSVDFCFQMHADASDAVLLWSESQPAVAVSAGSFSVRLGSITALSTAVENSPELFLKVSVRPATTSPAPACPPDASYTPLAGRQRLGSVAFALSAKRAIPGQGFSINMGPNDYGAVLEASGENYSANDPATRITLKDTTGNVPWSVSANDDGAFAIHQNGSGDRVHLNSDGRVGIGTTTPGSKLDVAGIISENGVPLRAPEVVCGVFQSGTLNCPAGKRVLFGVAGRPYLTTPACPPTGHNGDWYFGTGNEIPMGDDAADSCDDVQTMILGCTGASSCTFDAMPCAGGGSFVAEILCI